jgi:hypothetical protein
MRRPHPPRQASQIDVGDCNRSSSGYCVRMGVSDDLAVFHLDDIR